MSTVHCVHNVGKFGVFILKGGILHTCDANIPIFTVFGGCLQAFCSLPREVPNFPQRSLSLIPNQDETFCLFERQVKFPDKTLFFLLLHNSLPKISCWSRDGSLLTLL